MISWIFFEKVRLENFCKSWFNRYYQPKRRKGTNKQRPFSRFINSKLQRPYFVYWALYKNNLYIYRLWYESLIPHCIGLSIYLATTSSVEQRFREKIPICVSTKSVKHCICPKLISKSNCNPILSKKSEIKITSPFKIFYSDLGAYQFVVLNVLLFSYSCYLQGIYERPYFLLQHLTFYRQQNNKQ